MPPEELVEIGRDTEAVVLSHAVLRRAVRGALARGAPSITQR